MDENWYTNESVWSLSFFYPDPQEDQEEKKKKSSGSSSTRGSSSGSSGSGGRAAWVAVAGEASATALRYSDGG